MAREKRIEVAALNVVAHPHSIAKYVDLWRSAFSMRRPFQYWGSNQALIGSYEPLDQQDPSTGIKGQIYRFTNIDETAPWLNVRELEEAKDDELSEVQVPKHLKPNFIATYYLFLPRGHRFYFVRHDSKGKRLTPGQTRKILAGLLNREQLVEKFGKIEVTAVPTRESLDLIFTMPELRSLEIVLEKPNPDELDDFEEKVLRRLDNQNARRIDQRIMSERGKSIVPDEETEALAEIAAENGRVVGTGRKADGNRGSISTIEHPRVEPILYDPDVQTEYDAFIHKATIMHRDRNRRQR